ncbi:hypothetical protein M8J77_022490 [Diaphorina citri]|nr:hypothetical protein M8J77_022490 [Diaphorina citri]
MTFDFQMVQVEGKERVRRYIAAGLLVFVMILAAVQSYIGYMEYKNGTGNFDFCGEKFTKCEMARLLYEHDIPLSLINDSALPHLVALTQGAVQSHANPMILVGTIGALHQGQGSANNRAVSPGKRDGHSLMAASEPSPTPLTRRLFITEGTTKLQFLVDTGTDLCVFPRSATSGRREKSDYVLSAANSTDIHTYDTVTLSLNLGLRRVFTWRFVVADVSKPIIGADFLHYHYLLVDLRNQRLLDGTTYLTVQGHVAESNIPSVKTVNAASRYHQLLQQFKEITRPDGVPGNIEHNTRHHIKTTPGPPVANRPRRLAPAKLKAAKKRPQCSHHPRPIPSAPHSGLCSHTPWQNSLFHNRSAQTFQRFMDKVLRGLDFCFPYIDDVLVASETESQHLEHLTIIFERFQQYSLVLNPSKCVFGQPEVKFLGYLISNQGTCPLPNRVKDILDYVQPTTAKGLRQFLGMVNFYRSFMSRASDTLATVSDLLTDNIKGNILIQWTPDAIKAFQHCKEQLLCLPVPMPHSHLKLSTAEKKYGTYDRELLAIYLAVKHFLHVIEGRVFTIYTDHKPLTIAFLGGVVVKALAW